MIMSELFYNRISYITNMEIENGKPKAFTPRETQFHILVANMLEHIKKYENIKV